MAVHSVPYPSLTILLLYFTSAGWDGQQQQQHQQAARPFTAAAGSAAWNGAQQQQPPRAPNMQQRSSHADLSQLLQRLDGSGYGAYKETYGCWAFPDYQMHVDYVQSDPYAPPTKIRIQVRCRHVSDDLLRVANGFWLQKKYCTLTANNKSTPTTLWRFIKCSHQRPFVVAFPNRCCKSS